MNESELRAALHDGEGAPLDTARVLATARAAHRQRRVRLGSAAAAAVAVAAVGVGSAIAFGGGHGGDTTAAGSDASATVRAPSSGAPANPARPGAASGPAAVVCPARAPNLAPPRGPGPGRLFRAPVDAITACGYTADGAPLRAGGAQSTVLFGGPAARRLAATLESASAQPPAGACPMYRTGTVRVLVLLAVGPDGTRLPPVTARIGLNPCNRTATNGTAWRYGFTPPAGLAAILHQDTRPSGRARTQPGAPSAGSGTGRAATVSPSAPPAMHGSPVR